MNKIFSSIVLFAMIFTFVFGTLPSVVFATYGGGYGDYPDHHDDDDDKEDLCLNIPGVQETVPDGKERTEDGNCVHTEPESQTATIVATKIVCENESDLPNWGAGGPNINSTTATNFLENHPNCHQEDWTFEWAPASTGNPGDNDGEAGGEWESFEESITIDVPSNPSYVWVREVMQNDYVEFSGDTSARTDDVSAEFYCHVDVLNYDNYDRVDNMKAGKTYYCVGFNAEIEDEDECEEMTPTGSVEEGNAVLHVAEGSCPVKVSFSSYSHAGTIVPFEDQILIENITDTYGPGTHNIGPVALSCNWQTDLYMGDVQEHLIPGVGHTGLIAYDYVENQTCSPSNSAPQANAGADQTITLPINSVNLDGSGSGDSDGTITSYVWTFVSGPTTVDPSDLVGTTASPLVLGTYVFELTVTDDDGATDSDTVSITVNPEIIVENPECSDGINNDADGLIDMNDPGCHTDGDVNNPESYDPNDDDETNTDAECGDGINNNDFDSLIDSNDPACHTDGDPDDGDDTYDPNDDDESTECSDGINNEDVDSLIDILDPACHTDGDEDNEESYDPNDTFEKTECSDGIDNADTEDSLVDSNDPACHTDKNTENEESYDPNIVSESNGPLTECTDGIDNDDDGKIDFPDDLACDSPEDESEENEGGGGGSSSGGGSRRKSGTVLGAETTCGIYVEKFLRVGYNNNVEAVVKVQTFLNNYMNAGLEVDGIYGRKTEAAVNAFQLAHKDKILTPWGITAPTGIFYLTTQTEVNNIMCPSLNLPIPSNLINFSSSSQVPAPISPGYVLGASTEYSK